MGARIYNLRTLEVREENYEFKTSYISRACLSKPTTVDVTQWQSVWLAYRALDFLSNTEKKRGKPGHSTVDTVLA